VDGVVLLHGAANVPASLWRIERALHAQGYRTFAPFYPSFRHSIETLAERLQPRLEDFAAGVATVNVVAHSMGGLVARTWISLSRPQNLGRMVMLATPNGGSEWADVLQRNPLYQLAYGPAGAQLSTAVQCVRREKLGPPDYPVGVIAGERSINPLSALILPRPNDGTVSVASTRLDGMADHIVLPVSHTGMLMNGRVIDETIAFLRDGRFSHEV
jgi:hypothetical protein